MQGRKEPAYAVLDRPYYLNNAKIEQPCSLVCSRCTDREPVASSGLQDHTRTMLSLPEVTIHVGLLIIALVLKENRHYEVRHTV